MKTLKKELIAAVVMIVIEIFIATKFSVVPAAITAIASSWYYWNFSDFCCFYSRNCPCCSLLFEHSQVSFDNMLCLLMLH